MFYHVERVGISGGRATRMLAFSTGFTTCLPSDDVPLRRYQARAQNAIFEMTTEGMLTIRS